MQATKKKGRLVSARLVVNGLLYPQSFDSQRQALGFPASLTAIALQYAATWPSPLVAKRRMPADLPSRTAANAPEP